MHNLNFKELAKHKILNVEFVDFQADVVKASLDTVFMGRRTTKIWTFSYEDFRKIMNRGYI